MKSIRRKIKWRYLRKGFIYFLTWCLVLNTSLPAVMADEVPGMIEGENVVVGSAGFNTAGDVTTITTDSVSTIIEYSRFNIDSLKTVIFAQPDAASAVLNRIVEANPSLINGTLTSNGQVFIINPAGIIFGAGSTVNVTQLVASSLDISNQDFIDGNLEFFAGEGLGEVVNSGTINAAMGVALIGRKVQNTGTITAGSGGFVVMAAGDRVLLGEPASSVIVEMASVAPSDPENPDNLGDVTNSATGTITAPGGTIVLAAGDLFSTALSEGDLFVARVESGIGRVVQSGSINANGDALDGGSISLTAADEVTLTSGSMTTANAATGMDAGLVVVHSKDRTEVEASAQIQAIGGHTPYDLDNDFDDIVDTTVEISGDYVNFAGTVNASATDGKRGKIVIDALYMTIANGTKPATPPDNTVYEMWIEAQSNASTDVELVAHSKDAGNITTEHINDGVITGGSGDIVLRTKYNTGGINLLANGDETPTAIHTTEGGNIYMLAGGDDPDTTDTIEGSIVAGDIIADVPGQHWDGEPGKIRLLTTNGGNITTGTLEVEGGSYDEISAIADGDLTINGDVTTYAHQVDEEREVGQARTCLVSRHGSVEINGAIRVEAHGKYGTTADIHIDAGQDITIDLSGGQIRATAKTSSSGPANASVLLHAGTDTDPEDPLDIGEVSITGAPGNPIYLEAKAGGGVGTAQVSYTDDPSQWDEEVNAIYDEEGNLIEGAHAKLEVEEKRTAECPECPTPPGLIPPVDPFGFEVHMNQIWTDDVLSDSTLSVFAHTNPTHGTLIIDYETGEYQYTPDTGYVGEDSFTYQAWNPDTGAKSEWATVTITVTNEIPIANPDMVTSTQGETIIIDVLANDFDPDNLDSLTVLQDSITVQHGTLILNEDNTFTYIPDPSYTGEDVFTYAVTDGQIGAELTWVTVTILVTGQPAPYVAPLYTPAAPGLEPIDLEVSGCPALVKWAAAEIGTDERSIQIWIASALASAKDIQPCNTCADLKAAATILQDDGGTRLAALADVINEFASNDAPPTEEQMASIADAIANDIEGNVQYAAAREYIDALAAYIGILNTQMGISTADSMQIATDNYVAPLAESENVGVAAYVAARLTALGG